MAGQCSDNSRLRIPLEQMCSGTAINCIPVTDGEPNWTPTPDQLPIAVDAPNTTMWFYNCETSSWFALNLSLCQTLEEVDLTNIANVCNIVNVPILYSAAGQCIEGKITLQEFALRLYECIPKICDLPALTQTQVDNADSTTLAACVDGEEHRIPLPPKICDFSTLTQAQVNNAGSVLLGACVDGEEHRIPLPSKICSLPTRTQGQVDGATSVMQAACLDGEEVLIPLPIPQVTSVENPYACVPGVLSPPSGAPEEGTGPFRIGCGGELYVWICDDNQWITVNLNLDGLTTLNPGDLGDPCADLNFLAWYGDDGECVSQRKLTLGLLAALVGRCIIDYTPENCAQCGTEPAYTVLDSTNLRLHFLAIARELCWVRENMVRHSLTNSPSEEAVNHPMSIASQQWSLHVAADGVDEPCRGSVTRPLATITYAVRLLRKYRSDMAGPNKIFVHAGTYTGENILIFHAQARVKLIGDGVDQTFIELADTHKIYSANGGHIAVSELTLRGGATANPPLDSAADRAIYADTAGSVIVGPNVMIENFSSVDGAVKATRNGAIVITGENGNVTIRNNYSGVFVSHNAHVSIDEGVSVIDNTTFGVESMGNGATGLQVNATNNGYLPVITGNGVDLSPPINTTGNYESINFYTNV